MNTIYFGILFQPKVPHRVTGWHARHCFFLEAVVGVGLKPKLLRLASY